MKKDEFVVHTVSPMYVQVFHGAGLSAGLGSGLVLV